MASVRQNNCFTREALLAKMFQLLRANESMPLLLPGPTCWLGHMDRYLAGLRKRNKVHLIVARMPLRMTDLDVSAYIKPSVFVEAPVVHLHQSCDP